MRYTISDKLIAYLALLSGLSISAVAIYYSVAGLMAIFAAALIPIMIMGIVLEVGKLAATVWLKQNWLRAPRFLKAYLLLAILALMLLTSMGIFGYLSKAHLDQAVPTGDVADKVSLLDEKISTERSNIDAAKKALQQMDAQVDQMLGRTDTERGAERAVQIRRNQAKERAALQNDIAQSQKKIAALNEERAPIAKELRKVEAEVGPIKYIAALIYGDNADQNLLERAVRWVIIVIVLVFDPLAVILLLASQYSFQWFRTQDEEDDLREEYDFSSGVRGSYLKEKDKAPSDKQTQSTNWPHDAVAMNFPSMQEWKQDTLPDAEIKHQESIEENPQVQSDLDVEQPEIKSQEEKDALAEWNEMIAEAEKAVEAEKENEDNEILNAAAESEKQAMAAWKHDNPDSSLKLQRRLFDKGVIDKLPWESYLKPKADYIDEAVLEAKRWAEENPTTEAAKQAKDWVKERGYYIGLDTNSAEAISWMTHDDEGNQIVKTKEGYKQNAEQSESTIWQRIKDSKNE